MKIPVALPVVHVQITQDGFLRIDVDGETHHTDGPLSRGDLRAVLDQITTALDSPIRVDVTEADGTTYTDIATPPGQDPLPELESEPEPTITTATTRTRVAAPGIRGAGFHPGEEIAIAYIVARQTAEDDGTTALHLPPALLAARREELVLLGMTSHVIASLD